MRDGLPRECLREAGIESRASPKTSGPLSFDLGWREYLGGVGEDGDGSTSEVVGRVVELEEETRGGGGIGHMREEGRGAVDDIEDVVGAV